MKSFLLSISMMLLAVASVFAAAKDGEASVYQGYTTTVQIGSAYQRTLAKATGINYRWTSSNTSYFTVQSSNKNQATIKGIAPTSSPVRLNYYCSYYIDGYYRTMDFYYDITVVATTVSVTNVTLNQTTINLKTGETYQLSATVYPTNATNRNVNWSTTYYAVASVNNNGLVTANGSGTAKIWCVAADGSGAADYCIVNVSDPVVEASEITINDFDTTIIEGQFMQLTANVYPSNATDKTIKWSSSQPEIATIDDDGLLMAISSGTSTITASCGKVSAKSMVYVQASTSGIEAITVDTKNGLHFSEPIDVKVYDMMGVLRYAGVTSTIENLPKGLYIVKTESQTFKVKL